MLLVTMRSELPTTIAATGLVLGVIAGTFVSLATTSILRQKGVRVPSFWSPFHYPQYLRDFRSIIAAEQDPTQRLRQRRLLALEIGIQIWSVFFFGLLVVFALVRNAAA